MTEEPKRLNWSTLKYLSISPKLLKWRIEHPLPETPSMRLGRAIHCLVLEPGEFQTRWMTAGLCVATKKNGEVCQSQGSLYLDGAWFCRVKNHAPAGAAMVPKGVEVLTQSERSLVEMCAQSVGAHEIALCLLTGGAAEQTLEWQHKETGILCRGRVDYLRSGFVVDLKSTRRDTPREFALEAARHLYYAQLAWYHDGAIASGRLLADAKLPYIVSVSTSEPYDVAAFQLSKVAYQAGEILYRDLLIKYSECQASDWWPGAAPDLLTLDLPPWAAGMNGSEEGIESGILEETHER